MKINHILSICIGVAFFCIINQLISYNLTSISAITVTAWSDHEDNLKFYYSDSGDSPLFYEHKTSTYGVMPENKKTTLRVYMANKGNDWLRIDPGDQEGTVRLYSMVIHPKSTFQKHFDASQIYELFSTVKEGQTVTLKDDYVEILSTESDPYLISNFPSLNRQSIGLFSIPVAILSFFLSLFITKCNWKQIGEYLLLKRELPAGAELIQPLDGLRGIAAVWVVAEHSWPEFTGTGFSGVLIFFVLSGFLLAKPFVLDSSKIVQKGFLLKYGARRLQRILPMYYFYIFLVYWMPVKVDEALLHTFFIKGNGHLWAIPQEMLFYLIFPCLVLFHRYLFRDRLFLIISALILTIYCWVIFIDINTVYLCGSINEPIPFLLNTFLTGVLFSYFYYGYYQKRQATERSAGIRYTAAVLGMTLLLGFTFLSNGYVLNVSTSLYTKEFPAVSAIIAGLLIFLTMLSPNTFFTRFLSNSFLCSLGTVSFSLYLLHPLVIGLVKNIGTVFFALEMKGGMTLFLLVLPISYVVSCVTYRTIEHPFLAPGPKS